jgi:hypothetical protein
MTQSQLNRAVARLTGESVQTIQEIGFNLINVASRRSRSRRRRWRRRHHRRRCHLVSQSA